MSTQTRKQREIAAREQLILDTARKMFQEGGYPALSMDRIAEIIEYSKGTVYQHFANKDDLLGALAIETISKRYELFSKAADFQGRPRERMTGIGLADQILATQYPDVAATEHLLDVGSFIEKISEKRRHQLLEIKQNMMAKLQGIVKDGIACGDLIVPEDRLDDPNYPMQILYGLWTMSVGHAQMTCADYGVPELEDPSVRVSALFGNYSVLMDGYNWRPLTHEWDYKISLKRILEEVFPENYQVIQERNLASFLPVQ